MTPFRRPIIAPRAHHRDKTVAAMNVFRMQIVTAGHKEISTGIRTRALEFLFADDPPGVAEETPPLAFFSGVSQIVNPLTHVSGVPCAVPGRIFAL